MEQNENEVLLKRLRTYTYILTYLVILVSATTLAGWCLDNVYLIRIMPGLVPMNPVTGVSFILLEVLMLLYLRKGNSLNSFFRYLPLLVSVIAAIRILGFMTGWQFGTDIDQYLFHDKLLDKTSGIVNRLAPNTALNFLLSGLSMFFLFQNTRYSKVICQLTAIIVSGISLFALTGYLYSINAMYKIGENIPMALHTAFCFLFLSTSIQAISGGEGWMSILTSSALGGKTARKLLFMATVIPLLLGLLTIEGIRHEWFKQEFGIAMIVVGIIFIFTYILWRDARNLNITDEKRDQVEHELIKEKNVAESARELQERFLANMSHEIRTPMNAVIGMTNLLADTRLNEEQSDFVNTIKYSSDNLLVILNDILDLSKIRAGMLTFEDIDFNISELFKNVRHLLKPRAEERFLEFTMEIDREIPFMLKGDPTRLNQVLINLVGNAIKFTEKGKISFEARLVEEGEEDVKIEFSVIDTGIGIPPEKLSNIFESFSQATSSIARKYGGTGLGLTIVKQLVELQGGSIFVESEPGKGSTFKFILTYKKAKGQYHAGIAGTENHSNVEGINILLVEDNKVNRRIAVLTLEKGGAKIRTAANGQIALDMLREEPFDIILMDIQMPVMDGLETTKYIRERMHPPISQIPIIAMTASAMKSEMQFCFDAGMNEYVSKPFHTEDLYVKIRELTGEHF